MRPNVQPPQPSSITLTSVTALAKVGAKMRSSSINMTFFSPCHSHFKQGVPYPKHRPTNESHITYNPNIPAFEPLYLPESDLFHGCILCPGDSKISRQYLLWLGRTFFDWFWGSITSSIVLVGVYPIGCRSETCSWWQRLQLLFTLRHFTGSIQ